MGRVRIHKNGNKTTVYLCTFTKTRCLNNVNSIINLDKFKTPSLIIMEFPIIVITRPKTVIQILVTGDDRHDRIR